MRISYQSFGRTQAGEEATLYTLSNDNGMKVALTDYGANIVSIIVPDAKKNLVDVALGFDSLAGYEENTPGLGSFIGRHANRIAEARFTLGGKVYELDKNNGNNNLHGGSKGYNQFMYETEVFEAEDMISVEFSRLSPHMEQGFPGNLDITVTYSLTDNNELMIEYFAVSDRDTIVNLTNHSYFNLGGHDSGLITDHKVWINGNQFTPVKKDMIPTGEYWDVAGTPMDFTKLKRIGQEIDSDYEQLQYAGGYDHNYVLNIDGGEVDKVAELVDEESGRRMEVFTDMPGMQFYTGNFLRPVNHSKNGANYQMRSGVCFETQYFPNSCNQKEFPSCVLKAGKEYESTTIYRFLVS